MLTLCDYGSNNDTGVLQNSGLHDLFGENKVGPSFFKKDAILFAKACRRWNFPFQKWAITTVLLVKGIKL